MSRRYLAALLILLAACTPGTKPHIFQTPTSTVPVAIPASITADCTADVTVPILAWIATVPDGSILLFTSGACYKVENILLVPNRNNLIFEGNGATFRQDTVGAGVPCPVLQSDPAFCYAWPRNRVLWLIKGGTNITLRNMVLRGPAGRNGYPPAGSGHAFQAPWANQSAIGFYGVNGARAERVTASDVFGDFVFSFRLGPPGSPPASNIVVTSCTFDRANRQGISLIDVVGEEVVGNHISDVGFDGIDIEPLADTQVAGASIHDNDFSLIRFYTVAALSAGPVSGIQFVNNRIVGRWDFLMSAPGWGLVKP